MPSLNYQIIVRELKGRLARMTDAPDDHRQRIAEQTRQRFIFFLDEDQCLSSPCPTTAECFYQIDSYTCICELGYSGENCEGKHPAVQ